MSRDPALISFFAKTCFCFTWYSVGRYAKEKRCLRCTNGRLPCSFLRLGKTKLQRERITIFKVLNDFLEDFGDLQKYAKIPEARGVKFLQTKKWIKSMLLRLLKKGPEKRSGKMRDTTSYSRNLRLHKYEMIKNSKDNFAIRQMFAEQDRN